MKSTAARSFVHSAIALTVLTGSIAPAWAQTPPPTQTPPAQMPPPAQPAPTPAPAPAPAPGTAGPTYPAPATAQPPNYPGPYVSPQPGYPQPGLPPPRAPLPTPPKPKRALMITGISVFSAFYLLSVGIGASIMDGDEDDNDPDGYDDCRYCKDVGPWLFLPVAGPFVAMTQTPNDAGLMLLGMGQVVGAGLMIGGIILYKNTKRAAEAHRYGEIDLGKGRTLAVDVSTSARMTGPRMTLRF